MHSSNSNLVVGCAALLLSCADSTSSPGTTLGSAPSTDVDEPDEVLELEDAKLIIEHNATDEDTGFQALIDGEPWNRLDVIGPEGELALSLGTEGRVAELGFTELFFETDEPSNDEVPIAELLANLSEGEYTFRTVTVDGRPQIGDATFSHAIPAGPHVTSPRADASVCADEDLVIRWEKVTTGIRGEAVDVTHYQVIVERLEQPDHPGFGQERFDVRVPGTMTSVRVPHELLAPDVEYEWEVLAIEARGNQTITAGEITTFSRESEH